MAVRKLYYLDAGSIDLPCELLLPGSGPGRMFAPISMALIETDEGRILFDTGMHTGGITHPEETWGARGREMPPRLTEQDDVRHRLDDLGLTPRDMRYVVNSHLHWDHCGGNRFFAEATIVVQEVEYRFAFDPSGPVAGGYMRNHFDHPLNYRCVEGDFELVEGVSLILTRGHTPGHQSLLVRLPQSGTIILAGDAVYSHQNIARNVVSGNVWRADETVASVQKLTTLAGATGATIIPGHEPELWQQVRRAPGYYT